jgi:hypothetical protein
VTYPLDEIFLFEERALHEATWERGSDVVVTSERLYSAQEVPPRPVFPCVIFTHPNMRKALEIPCIRVGKLVRFKLDEVTAWAKRTHVDMTGFGVQDTSDQRTGKAGCLCLVTTDPPGPTCQDEPTKHDQRREQHQVNVVHDPGH